MAATVGRETHAWSLSLWLVALLAWAGLALPGCAADEPSGARLRIVSPARGASVGGVVPVSLQVAEDVDARRVSFQVGQSPPIELREVREGWLWNSLTRGNGRVTLAVALSDGDELLVDSVEVSVDNPVHQLDSYRPDQPQYQNGDELVVDLKYPVGSLVVTADLGALDSEFSEDRLSVESLDDGAFRLRYAISTDNAVPDGTHPVIVEATDESGVSVRSRLTVELQNVPPLPFRLDGAALLDESPPAASAAAAGPRLSVTRADRVVLSGGTAEIELSWQPDPSRPVRAILVGAEGHSGHYVLPLDDGLAGGAGDSGSRVLSLSGFSFSKATDVRNISILIALVDAFGVVEWIEETLELVSALTGGVQVSLTWDAPVDLDLHVVEPGGQVLDWENPSLVGGVLDLDSNSLCVIDGVNAENVAWVDSNAPLGPYEVRVNLYDACGQETVNWTATVIACGATQRITGSLSAEQAILGGIGRVIATFDVNCQQQISGVVTGELPSDDFDSVVSASLLDKQLSGEVPEANPPRSAIRPLPHIPVFALDVDDPDAPLATATTAADGSYELRFSLPAGEEYFVEARANVIEPGRNTIVAHVLDASSALNGNTGQGFKKQSQLFRSTGGLQVVNSVRLDVSRAEDSGAFYIASRMSDAVEWLRAKAHKGTPAFGVAWNRSDGSFYNDCIQLITLDLKDAFDDSVIAHEFMHHAVHSHAGVFNNLFGDRDRRTFPSQAVDEGLATFLAQAMLGTPIYLDLDPDTLATVSRDDLEGDPDPFFRGVDSSGQYNEILVGMVLWDLIDGVGSEAHDAIDGHLPLVVEAVFERLPREMARRRAAFPDRPEKPGCDDAPQQPEAPAELGEVLDAYRCAAESRSLLVDAELEAISVERGFPYDARAPVSCP